jgi:hypothetical protein
LVLLARGYEEFMDVTENTPRENPDPSVDDLDQDQDSEATMNAPEPARPDGLDALEDDESMGGDGSPS